MKPRSPSKRCGIWALLCGPIPHRRAIPVTRGGGSNRTGRAAGPVHLLSALVQGLRAAARDRGGDDLCEHESPHAQEPSQRMTFSDGFQTGPKSAQCTFAGRTKPTTVHRSRASTIRPSRMDQEDGKVKFYPTSSKLQVVVPGGSRDRATVLVAAQSWLDLRSTDCRLRQQLQFHQWCSRKATWIAAHMKATSESTALVILAGPACLSQAIRTEG